MSGHTLFIGDLHLSPMRMGTVAAATAFVQGALGAHALYIIGDLFEYWLGDDHQQLLPELHGFIEALAALRDAGTELHLMHGNRDFLLGQAFAHRLDAHLHTEDSIQLPLADEPILLMHGDTLCTGDTDYLRLRQQVRDPAWQARFLARTLAERTLEAEALRARSRDASATKSTAIMDVSQDAVEAALKTHGGGALVHGHTHRPGEHRFKLPGTGTACRRLVVGDWHDDGAVYARHDGQRLSLHRFNHPAAAP